MSAPFALAFRIGLAGLACSLPTAAGAADEAAVLRVRAAQLAGADRCPDALPLLRRARALDPEDARAALLEGQCLFHEKRYAEAVPALEAAARLDPALGDAELLLGMAHYHRGELAQSEAALARAEALLPDRAEIPLYRGLVLLEEARLDDAAGRFDRASRLGRDRLEPAASYYTGLALAGAGKREEAEEALARVGRIAPGSEWQRLADEALASPESAYELRRWLVLEAGLEYDSNVALRGQRVSLPDDISNEDDGRAVWSADAGTELFRNEDWGAGVLSRYNGTVHFHENDFDQHAIGTSVWVDRRVGESSLVRLSPEFGASFYDYDDYLRFYGLLGELVHDFGDPGVGRGFARYAYNDFRYDILGDASVRSRRNRDGHSVIVGYDHTHPLREGTLIQGGVFYATHRSDGREYRYHGGGAWLGFRQELPWAFVLDVRGGIAGSGYDDSSTFLQAEEKVEDRSDVLGSAEVSLERPLPGGMVASARWLYYESDSNTRVFDYDRHIVGAYLTVAFGD